MSPLSFTLITFFTAVAAGLLGSLLGVGGGIVLVPVLTLMLKVEIHDAIGASLIGVVATSTGAAASYVREHVANIRLGMVLEVATVTGAIVAAYVSGYLPKSALFIIFGLLMFYSGGAMFVYQLFTRPSQSIPDPLADKLKLHGSFHDGATNADVPYQVTRVKTGVFVSFLAGIISGLLGVGGGLVKVPVMHLSMRLPIKAATATSNFMMGVTAAASAGVYFSRGQIVPLIVAPVATGVLIGSMTGAKLLPKIQSNHIRIALVIVMLYTGTQMMLKGFHHG